MNNIVYQCGFCGEAIATPYVNQLPVCRTCQACLPWLNNLGVDLQFFSHNFLWFKDVGGFFSEGTGYGELSATVKKFKVVKSSLSMSILYDEIK